MSLPFAGIVVVWSGDEPRHDVYRIGERFVLGRDLVSATDEQISRQHTAFFTDTSRVRVADCESRNGTFVEGQQIDAYGVAPALPAIVRSGQTLAIALADVRTFEEAPISRRGSVVVAGCLARQVRAVDQAALAEENVMIFGAASIGRELALAYAARLGGTCVVIDTRTASVAGILRRAEAMRTIIVIVAGPISDADWSALATWAETDVRFVFVMRHETHAIGMPTALATKLAGTLVSIPRLRFDELPTTIFELVRTRVPEARVHVSAIENALVRARTTDEDVLLAAIRREVDRWNRQGWFRAG